MLIGWRSNRKSFLAMPSLNYKRAQVVLINNTAKMSDEHGCAAATTGPRAALHVQRLLSWMLILKWTPAKTLQGTKAECDTVPATVPTRILSVANILTADANNSSNNSSLSNMQVQELLLEVGGLSACVGLSPVTSHCAAY